MSEPTKAEGPYNPFNENGKLVFEISQRGVGWSVGLPATQFVPRIVVSTCMLKRKAEWVCNALNAYANNGASSRDGEAAEAVSTAVDLCNAARKAEVAKLTDALAASRERLETAVKALKQITCIPRTPERFEFAIADALATAALSAVAQEDR